MSRRHVILGNGIAGQSCAEELRKLEPESEIMILAKEDHPLYSRVALPRYLRGQIDEKSVFLRSKQSSSDLDIEVQYKTCAVSIDAGRRIVVTDRDEEVGYDSLLIATGGLPKPPAWPGTASSSNLLAFQTVEDARILKERAASARRVLVIGGGFIAYELAEAIGHDGSVAVTWAMRSCRFLSQILDEDAGNLCVKLAAEAGIELLTETSVESLDDHPAGIRARFSNGESREFDFVAYGIGLDYASEAAAGLGVKKGAGIATDESLRTVVPNIYAAGDIAVFHDVMLGRSNQMGSWDSAQSQGKFVAANMAGGNAAYVAVPTYTTTLFGSAIAVLGHCERKSPDIETERRYCGDRKLYQQLYFNGESLVGALIIGPPKGRKKLVDLIHSRAPCRMSAFSHLPS